MYIYAHCPSSFERDHSIFLIALVVGLRLGVGVGLEVGPGLGFLGADAFWVAPVALGALGSCRPVNSLAVGEAALAISVEAPAVRVAALEVPVEVLLANLLWAAAMAIWPESAWAWPVQAPALAPVLSTLSTLSTLSLSTIILAIITECHCLGYICVCVLFCVSIYTLCSIICKLLRLMCVCVVLCEHHHHQMIMQERCRE